MKAINDLLATMKALRDPQNGCPWDMQQTIESILPYTLEEVYELVDAIERNNMEEMSDELGDLLFHIVFYTEMASESGHFDLKTVAEKINDKLRRRHPHVFADEKFDSVAEQTLAWERIKQQERKENQGNGENSGSLLDGIGMALPALIRAQKIQKRAATVGFDWASMRPVFAKIEEEINELRQAMEENANRDVLAGEIGDLLFACVNFCRHSGIEPEIALRNTNRKFENRFRYIEQQLHEHGKTLTDATLDEMEVLWQQAKMHEC